MMAEHDRKIAFWEHKILRWEHSRYNPYAFVSGRPIRNRLKLAATVLNQTAGGMRLIDLGCGSGRLFELLQQERFSGLTGLDLSGNAISEARSKHWTGHVTFRCGCVNSVELGDFECVVALGLLDWLSPHEIDRLFSRLEGKRFFFSFSERSKPHLRLIHSAYLRLSGALSSQPYYPQSLRRKELEKWAKKNDLGDFSYYRHRSLSFGAIFTNLPIEQVQLPGSISRGSLS